MNHKEGGGRGVTNLLRLYCFCFELKNYPRVALDKASTY